MAIKHRLHKIVLTKIMNVRFKRMSIIQVILYVQRKYNGALKIAPKNTIKFFIAEYLCPSVS